jgi:RHS repeat-associated protein
MKSIQHRIYMPLALLLATLFATELAQADNKRSLKEQHKTAELKVTKAGAGKGEATITSIPSGIDCGGTCRAEFTAQSQVTLTATAAAGSAFQRWGGACQGTAPTPTCTVTLKEAQNVTAVIDRLPITLNVTKTGTGTGIVTSAPAGIDCGAVCSASFPQKLAAHQNHDARTEGEEDLQRNYQHDDNERHGKPAVFVTLTATPATGSTFEGWSGACAGSAATCTVMMEQTQNVTARFMLMPMALTTTKTGNGTGTIASLQTGIDCGATCSGIYNWGTTVTLAVTPAVGSVFNGWSGACTGTDTTCNVTMDQLQAVNADFTLLKLPLTVTQTGRGTGTLTSAPAGIDCGALCSSSYDWGTAVTLTAVPSADSLFQGWTGACTGTASVCTVTMDQAQNVTADFAPAFKPLSVATLGSGAGTITSSPSGIDCGTACRADFAPSTIITLTASSASGSTFGGWSGACTGSAATCTVILDQARSVNVTFSAPAITTYQYDANGNLTQVTDPLGRIRQIQYDALNQPVRQLEPHPTIIGSTLGQIDTAYDSLGQIQSITDPRNLTTTYTIDSLGNLSQQTSPDTGVTTADHDPAGNLLTRTDARGKTATYSYDSLNRITQIAYDDQTVTYTWDSCSNGIGRLCNVSNAGSRLEYRYDNHGRITQRTQTAGGAPLAVSHSYNTAGQRIQTVTPSGQTLDYQWSGGRLTALSVNGQPLLTQIGYEPDGQVNGWVWGNNQPSERFYDLTGRPVIVSLGVDAKTQQPDSRTYGYDAAGRLTDAIDDNDPSLNQQHAYDELDRLIGSERGELQISRIGYAYDLSGNRTENIQDNTTQYRYSTDANSNRLQSQSGAQAVNYSYDPAGHLTGDGTVSYTYNAAGRRISVTAANLNASYTYNAVGQRVTKTVNGTTTQYAYDEHGHLTGEYEASGQLIQEIVWLGDLPVAVLKPATPTNQTNSTIDLYYLHADHLGTPRKITRPNDNKTFWSWESEAFGNSLPDQNPPGLGSFVFNLRFPGQYYDAETGLHYNYFRDYDPRTGKYIESDPVGLKGGVNTYVYVRNNPVNRIDPLGLYDTLNCIVSQCAQIADAVTSAQNAANQQGIGGEVSKILDKTTFECRKPDKTKNYCGANNDPDIYLRNAFNKRKCGSLASTILHEVSHSAPLKYSEMDAYILENKAFGTSIPTPEQLQLDYPNLSPEQIEYYRGQQ